MAYDASDGDAADAPVTVKILIAGGFGAGKTTLVSSVSEVRPLRTAGGGASERTYSDKSLTSAAEGRVPRIVNSMDLRICSSSVAMLPFQA